MAGGGRAKNNACRSTVMLSCVMLYHLPEVFAPRRERNCYAIPITGNFLRLAEKRNLHVYERS